METLQVTEEFFVSYLYVYSLYLVQKKTEIYDTKLLNIHGETIIQFKRKVSSFTHLIKSG